MLLAVRGLYWWKRDQLLQQSRWEVMRAWWTPEHGTEGAMPGGAQDHQIFVPLGISLPNSLGPSILWTSWPLRSLPA